MHIYKKVSYTIVQPFLTVDHLIVLSILLAQLQILAPFIQCLALLFGMGTILNGSGECRKTQFGAEKGYIQREIWLQ